MGGWIYTRSPPRANKSNFGGVMVYANCGLEPQRTFLGRSRNNTGRTRGCSPTAGVGLNRKTLPTGACPGAATGTVTTKINEIRHGSSFSAESPTEVRFVTAH